MKHEGVKAGSFGDGSEIVIGACIEVHRHLGPGLLESAYEQCLCHELSVIGVAYERQEILPLCGSAPLHEQPKSSRLPAFM